MRIRLAFAFALLPWLAGCDSILDTDPTDRLPDDKAITSAEGARAALTGAYSALGDFDAAIRYYGGDFTFFGDLSSDNAISTGTFTSYADADANQLRADNATTQDIWNVLYDAINRANNLLEKVPALTDLDDGEKNEILGEAYFLRALHYHNLVKVYGAVPIRLVPVTTVDEAAAATRAPGGRTSTPRSTPTSIRPNSWSPAPTRPRGPRSARSRRCGPGSTSTRGSGPTRTPRRTR